MASLKQFIKANAAPPPRPVTFVPGNLFFTRTVALPEGMKPTDVYSFAELTLEEMSPFSLEHLAWGYVTDAANRWLLIMAACRPRIPAPEMEGWDEALFVLPGFYPLLTGAEALAGSRALLQGNCLTLAHYEGDCPLPMAFTHEVIETEGNVVAEAQALFAAERPTESRESGLPVLQQGWEERDGSAVFELVCLREGEVLPVVVADEDDASAGEAGSLEETASADASLNQADMAPAGTVIPVCIENLDTVWPADLREPDFKKKEQQSRRMSAGLWKGMLAAGILTAVLVIGVCAWIILAGVQSSRQARILRQAPEVQALELKQQNLEDLKQFAGSPFRPYDILDDLNVVKNEKMRSNGIYFDSVALSKDNEVTVRGRAGSIVEVNNFADALTASGLFEQITPPDYQSRGSAEVRFTLELRYLPPPASAQADSEAEPAAQPQTADTPESAPDTSAEPANEEAA
jgi:Tfp pilus assembly protein PilN